MPVAVPAIAAFAAQYAAVELSAGAILAGSLAASAIGLGASLVASVAMSALMSKPRGFDASALLSQPGGGRTFQFRQPTPSRQVILGRAKVSGPVMFMHSKEDDDGRADGYFYLQIAIAGHKCQKIADVFINDAYSTDSKYDGFFTIGKNLGTSSQTEDALFLADLGADVFGDHWLRGVTNIAARLKGSATAYPNGLPNLSAIVWGSAEIYDPRTGTTGWTNNAALCYAWWKTWSQGQKVAWADIDEDTLIDSANVADERERVAPSTTTFSVDATTNAFTLAAGARALDVGDGVRVETTGALPSPLVANTTYYVIPSDAGTIKLATSVANAFSETAIDIATTGTGTQTLRYWDEARYKLNGSFTLDQDKGSIQEQLLTAMMGHDVEVGGKWFIHASAPITPTQTLDEDDLRGTFSWQPKRSMRDKFNGVRSRFVNPDKGWQPDDAPPLLSSAYVAEDNGVVLYEDANFPFTTSGRAVQRMSKLHLERNRLQGTGAFPAMYTAIPLRPRAGCYIDWDRYGWEQRQMVVTGWKLTEEFGVDLMLQEDSAAAHAWDAAVDEQLFAVPQGVTLPDPSAIAPPAAVTVETPITPTYTRIKASWDEVLSIWNGGYDVEYRDAGAPDWTGYGRVGGDDSNSALEVTVERSEAQDFQVRAVTKNGSPSAFTQSLAPAAASSVIATGVLGGIDLAWTNGARAAEVQIFVNTTNDFSGATLLDTVAGTAYSHAPVAGGQQRSYWLRSVAADGNFSVQTATVDAIAL
jgi:hypothetical protein